MLIFNFYFQQKMIDNPWLVESIQDFYFLKCPECSFDTQQEIIFQQHSIENHPLSYVFFQTKCEGADPFEGFKIKKEPEEFKTSSEIKQETTNDNYDYYGYYERDIKNEFVDANEQPSYDHSIKPKKRQRKQKIEERIGFGEEIEEQIPTGIKSDTVKNEFVDNEELYVPLVSLEEPNNVDSAVYEEKKPIVEINYHIVQIKQDEIIPHCSKCDRNFDEKEELFDHMASTHKDEKSKIPCSEPECAITEKCLSKLKMHYKEVHEKNEKYQCSACDKSFFRKRSWYLHIKAHNAPSKRNKEGLKYNCRFCSDKFSGRKEWRKHVSTVHQGEKPFKCDFCEKAYKEKYELKKHIAIIHEGIIKPIKQLQCFICQQKFTSRNRMNIHIASIHEGKKPFRCSICDIGFAENKTLKTHTKLVHENKKKLECPLCESSFSHKRGLTMHTEKVHEKKEYNCLHCEDSFPNKTSLSQHNKEVHEGKRLAKCHKCVGSYLTVEDLEKHIAISHDGPKPYLCALCESTFTTKKTLEVHVEAIHEGKKPNLCTVCGMTFHKKFALKYHIESVHEGKKNHACTKCEKQFYAKIKLVKHFEEVHEGKKNHYCSVCNRGYYQAGNLRKHMLIHEKERPDKSP